VAESGEGWTRRGHRWESRVSGVRVFNINNGMWCQKALAGLRVRECEFFTSTPTPA
jgi:hypothetical protein